MKSKKFIRTIALFMLVALTLTGCSSMSASSLNSNELQTCPPAITESLLYNPTDPTTVITSAHNSIESAPNPVVMANSTQPETGLSINSLDAGQGLGLIIQADGYTVLYDGGSDNDTSDHTCAMTAWLQEHQIKSIDLLIASDFEENHIAGLTEVLNDYPVKTVLCGNYNDGADAAVAFHRQLKNTEAELFHPVAGDVYSFGKLKLEILSPVTYNFNAAALTSAGSGQDYSITLRLSFGDIEYVISDDAEFYEFTQNQENSSSTESPSPEENTINYSSTAAAIAGGVAAANSGSNEADSSSDNDSETYTYIANKHTKVIHYPWCPSVDQMKESNKWYTNESISSLESQGYRCCKRCKP